MLRPISKFFLLALPLLPPAMGTAELALAQEEANQDILPSERAPAPNIEPSGLAGLSSEELVRKFGVPDKKSADGLRETWTYGQSEIFITDGRVSAWSDSGDLFGRRVKAGLSPRGAEKEEKPLPAGDGWVNAWQKEKKVTSEEVIDEIISK